MNYSALRKIKTYDDYINAYEMYSRYLLDINNKNILSSEYDQILNTFIQDNSVTPEESIKNITSYLKNLETLNLKLAFNPTKVFIEKVLLILTQNINQHFLLKVENDPHQFLGAQLEFKGKIFSHSIFKTS